MNKLFNTIVIIIACTLANIANAQDTLTIDKALEIAHTNNPGLKAAQLHVEREKAMLKSNIVIDKTQFSYSLGQINSNMIDYSINVNQSFNFPAFGVRKNLLQAKVNAGESNLEIAQSELNRSVRIQFVTLSNLQQQLELYQEQELLYQIMAEIAIKKIQVGETNILEKSIAESKFEEMKIFRQKIEMDIASHTSNLSLLLFAKTQSINIDKEVNLELPLIDSSKLSANPLLGFYKKSIEIKEEQVRLNKKEYFPDFNIGYFNQQIEGIQNLQGVQVGLSIPLFYRPQKATLKAAKIDVDISSYQMDDYLLSLHQLFQSKLQNYNKHKLEVEYYQSKGEKLARQLTEFANRAYTVGEIGYLEYMESLNLAKQIKISFLQSLQNYQSEIIELLYLTGQ